MPTTWYGPNRKRRARPGVGRVLLRMPLFYKVLLANAAIVVLVAAASAAAAGRLLRGAPELASVALFLLIGSVCASVTLPLYAAVLRLALGPLDALEHAAEKVAGGQMDARAPLPRIADPRLERVIRVFNRLLDGLAADRQRLREVAARAFRAQESERVRMAHELEGETAQSLSAILLRLRIARRSTGAAAREKLLDALRDDIVGLTDRIRDFAGMLHSPTLAEVGLVPAIEGYCRRVAAHSGVEITVRGDAGAGGMLAADGELALYRVVQEALSNVLRHAGASKARVEVAREGGCVVATIRDDGRGFEVGDTEAREPCLGFFGMRERALYAGGAVEVESAPGAGTRVKVRIPVAGAADRLPARAARPALEATAA
ncbi:sensor histidine kinase [Longimicrobium sp.]|uniref:sensor histidine kinase n=1 Tax=Longimicrobium sp. TaxID=2029185 RepID=UPI002CE96476|nr:ATP-binding protein [Longimicrobium sp.]HSU17034.1 ATP-binding protein [Longimicrobium sp.]